MTDIDFTNLRMILELKTELIDNQLHTAMKAADTLTRLYAYDQTPALMGNVIEDNTRKAINEIADLLKTVRGWIDHWQETENKLKEASA